jgi:hypothetical protein
MDPVPDPLLLRKCGSAGNPTRDLWDSNQELWPLDHRDGLTFIIALCYYYYCDVVFSILDRRAYSCDGHVFWCTSRGNVASSKSNSSSHRFSAVFVFVLKAVLLMRSIPRISVVKELYGQAVCLTGNVCRGIVTGLWLIVASSARWWIERATTQWSRGFSHNNAQVSAQKLPADIPLRLWLHGKINITAMFCTSWSVQNCSSGRNFVLVTLRKEHGTLRMFQNIVFF